MSNNGWIGVDLDGTLAHYDGWKGPMNIGAPIPKMVARVKAWLDEGKEVRIFTARVSLVNDDMRKVIENAIGNWCYTNIGERLAVTCVKDFKMIELWDDRCVQVITNTGESFMERIESKVDVIFEKLKRDIVK